MEAILKSGLTRIVLTGSESTGKTTLATQLATHYGCEFVPEFVREYAEQKHGPLTFADHGPITRGQIALEDTYATRATSLLIQDADLLSTVAYCTHYFGMCPAWIEEAAVARRPALYLLCDIDVPWAADGVRDRGDRREEMHALFVETLARLGAPYREVRGIGATRFARARSLIDDARRATTP